jgi:peptide/nickel transport system permease protein
MTGRPGPGGGAALLALVTAAVALGPLLVPYAPERPDFAEILATPSALHWMGTDDLGRDVLARVLAGGRVSLLVAAGGVAAALLAGAPLGLASGHLGGWLEHIAMRCVDALLAVPAILLALAITAVFGASAPHATLAIALVNLPVFARVAHAQARGLRGREYVAAARGFGCGEAAILWRCILPNAAGPMLVQATTLFASAMLTESYLSFLGLGAQPPTPSWGGMVHDGMAFLDRDEWLPCFPGAALFLAVLGANLLGDGLRDRLDPALERMA